MGGGASTDQSAMNAVYTKRTIKEVVQVMMPVYYTETPVSPDDFALANAGWEMILDDASPVYLELKKNGNEMSSCIMLFYDTFYKRLFDVHPMCKPMFKSGMKSQGKALVKIVSLSLSMMNEQEKFDNILRKLAVVHNEKGVKAVEYGIMGECLIWSLKQTLGPDMFTPDCKKAWVRVFCRMIRIMIPLAVHYEIENGTAQKARMNEQVENDEELERKFRSEHSSQSGTTASTTRNYSEWGVDGVPDTVQGSSSPASPKQ